MEKLTLGQRCADLVARFFGSWSFIILSSIVILIWMAFNTYSIYAFDKPPFIGLNLVLSCVAAYQAPMVMMAANRQSEIDRIRDDNDYKIDKATNKRVDELNQKVDKILEIISEKNY